MWALFALKSEILHICIEPALTDFVATGGQL